MGRPKEKNCKIKESRDNVQARKYKFIIFLTYDFVFTKYPEHTVRPTQLYTLIIIYIQIMTQYFWQFISIINIRIFALIIFQYTFYETPQGLTLRALWLSVEKLFSIIARYLIRAFVITWSFPPSKNIS